MPEPDNEPITDAFPEPPGTSAVIDDVEVTAAVDQYPMADLSDLDFEGEQ